jgi:hypothetical protein
MTFKRTIGIGTRLLAFAVALLSVVFLTQVGTHIHQNGQNETTCQVCQALHFSSLLLSAILFVCVSPQIVGYVEPFIVVDHHEFFFHHSPSRAPPSFPA